MLGAHAPSVHAQPVWQSLFDPQGNWHFWACRLQRAPMQSASALHGVAIGLGAGLAAAAVAVGAGCAPGYWYVPGCC